MRAELVREWKYARSDPKVIPRLLLFVDEKQNVTVLNGMPREPGTVTNLFSGDEMAASIIKEIIREVNAEIGSDSEVEFAVRTSRARKEFVEWLESFKGTCSWCDVSLPWRFRADEMILDVAKLLEEETQEEKKDTLEKEKEDTEKKDSLEEGAAMPKRPREDEEEDEENRETKKSRPLESE